MTRRKESSIEAYHNSMTHEELQNSVIDLAHSLGWKVAGFRKAQYQDSSWSTPLLADAEGWPDLFLVHEGLGQAIAIEIKTARDTVKPAQQLWLARLVICGISAYVVRPRDWHSGEVDKILEAKGEV